jgi:hypothetical protein
MNFPGFDAIRQQNAVAIFRFHRRRTCFLIVEMLTGNPYTYRAENVKRNPDGTTCSPIYRGGIARPDEAKR